MITHTGTTIFEEEIDGRTAETLVGKAVDTSDTNVPMLCLGLALLMIGLVLLWMRTMNKGIFQGRT